MKLAPGRYFGEQLGQRASEGVCLTLSSYAPGSKLPKHSHQNPGFFLLLAGDHLERNGHGFKYQPETSLLFHQSDAPHETEVGPRGMTGLNIAFERDWLSLKDASSLGCRDGWLLQKPLAKVGALKLLAALGAKTFDVAGEALQLLDLISVCGTAAEKRPPSWLRKIRERLEEEFDRPLSLAALAADACVHPVYLARAFRLHYGCTITECLHHVRVLRAVAAVCAGMTIGDAAAEVGFCDQGYLARIVKTKLGVSPSALTWFRSSKPSEPR